MAIKVTKNNDYDWDGLNLEVKFVTPITDEEKKKFMDIFSQWANLGVDEGYGGGYIHHWGKFEFSKLRDGVSVFMDMGMAGEEAFAILAEKLTDLSFVEEIKVGFEQTTD